MIETLDVRRLLDATLSGDTLTIQGSSAPDTIQVFDSEDTSNGPFRIHVKLNGREKLFDETVIKHVQVSGLGGNDVIRVGLAFFTPFTTASPFTVSGGNGDDSIIGAVEDDTIFGGPGNDTINSGGGDGLYAGGAGNDSLISNDTDNPFGEFHGGPGNDAIVAVGRQETVQGDSGIDTLDLSPAFTALAISFDGVENDGFADPIFQDEGERMHVTGDFERIIGGRGNDRITGDNTSETIFGGGGNDTIHGGGGNDVIYGGLGHDKLFGDGGADTLIGAEPGHHTQLRDTLDGGGDDGDKADDIAPDVLRNF